MILTIIADTMASSAGRLAKRRALAGRNVLFLKQNCERKQSNQFTKECDIADWSRTEMKAGTSSSALSSEHMIKELADANNVFHDVIIDIPKPFYADAKLVLANSKLLIFHMELRLWNKERQANLLRCIRLARKINCHVPALITVDKIDSTESQNFVSQLAHSLDNIKFIYLDGSGELPIANLYRAIYLS